MSFTTFIYALKRFGWIFLCGGISTLFFVFVSDPTAFIQSVLPDALDKFVVPVMTVFGTSIIAAVKKALDGYLKYDVKLKEGAENP